MISKFKKIFFIVEGIVLLIIFIAGLVDQSLWLYGLFYVSLPLAIIGLLLGVFTLIKKEKGVLIVICHVVIIYNIVWFLYSTLHQKILFWM